MIGVDFFLHGGVFAAIYLQESRFLLSAVESFRRIPFGYLAFLVNAGFVVWIVERASARGWRDGLTIGLCLGGAVGISFMLGIYSISSANPQLLAAWFVAHVLETAIAGAIAGHGWLVQSLRTLAVAVVIGFVLLLVGTIVLQSAGLAPSVRM
jgi:hypothetical protein